MLELNACRLANPEHYIRMIGYDRSYGRQTTALSFIVNRPTHERGFRLERQEVADRQVHYTLVRDQT
jgi:ribulose-bisphosphate carboxylase small chain